MFARLMAAQWLFGVVLALWVSPRTWFGASSQVHIHVWAAVLLGGVIASLPAYLALKRPGEPLTRHVIAVGQMLFSALLIHLTGGRIETHFHVFGSLAFLAFYRDWRVLMTASAVVVLDHGLRGVFWPQSVYGISVIQAWRFLEHTAWVAFEDVFLYYSIMKGKEEMLGLARRQAMLEEVNRDVEAKVIRRTEQLARSNAELEQFAYAASHDLREPLRKVTNFTQLLSKRYHGRLDSEADRFMDCTVDGAVRMTALIDSLLQLSRAGSGEAPLVRIGAGDVLDRVLSDLEVSQRESGASVARGPLPEIEADPREFARLLQNLISNAFKFRGSEAPRVHVSAELGAAQWTFRVRDNGIGIDPKHASRIFGMFRRLHSRAEYPGTGIGLAICKKIVERRGGRIWIEPEPRQGSCFCFTWPALTEPGT